MNKNSPIKNKLVSAFIRQNYDTREPIVDDGSPDNTARMCFANLHISASRWHHEKNLAKTMKHLIWSCVYPPRTILKTLKLQPKRDAFFEQSIIQKK